MKTQPHRDIKVGEGFGRPSEGAKEIDSLLDKLHSITYEHKKESLFLSRKYFFLGLVIGSLLTYLMITL